MNKTIDRKMQRLIEKYRYAQVDYDGWSDFVIDDWSEKVRSAGIKIEPNSIAWGLFRQGHGASFEGSVEDWDKFFQFVNEKDISDIGKAFFERHASFYWKRGESCWRHVHEDSVQFTLECELPQHDEDEKFLERYGYADGDPEDVRNVMLMQELLRFEKESLEEAWGGCVRGLMRELRDALYREHDCLTSDEAVMDYIIEAGLDEGNEDQEESFDSEIDSEEEAREVW